MRRLVVFLKGPRAGEVKTRLAASIGDPLAVEVYRALTSAVMEATRPTGISDFTRVVCFAPADAADEIAAWFGDEPLRAQAPGDLGHRMDQKIPHAVLNAKYHRQEAEIVARAGQRGAVTIATNMAGRGTDIKLGEGVAELGGLMVLATERHESRRVDRQLRGRCARQGVPGESKFCLAFEDDLMRNFGAADRMTKIM